MTKITDIGQLQNTMRAILKCSRYAKISVFFFYNTTIFINKIGTGHSVFYLQQQHVYVRDLYDHYTKQVNDSRAIHSNTERGRKSIFVEGITEYTCKLPVTVRISSSLNSFKIR